MLEFRDCSWVKRFFSCCGVTRQIWKEFLPTYLINDYGYLVYVTKQWSKTLTKCTSEYFVESAVNHFILKRIGHRESNITFKNHNSH